VNHHKTSNLEREVSGNYQQQLQNVFTIGCIVINAILCQGKQINRKRNGW